jgi:hypothetical protein
VACSVVRSHEQTISFHMVGTRLGPGLNLAPPAFFIWLKGAVSACRPTSARVSRAQAAVNDRASDRDMATKASLMVASTVLLAGKLE